MRGLIDFERKWYELIGCCTFYVAFSYDFDLGFSRSNFGNVVSQEWEGPLTWNERDASWWDVRLTLWLQPLTSPMTLTFDFQGKILKLLYLRNGKVDSFGMKGMWVGYDVGCTTVLTLGHGAWQINWPSNESMWNSYSFQPVAQWMGYSFTDLGAEGCCRSLNALFINVEQIPNIILAILAIGSIDKVGYSFQNSKVTDKGTVIGKSPVRGSMLRWIEG